MRDNFKLFILFSGSSVAEPAALRFKQSLPAGCRCYCSHTTRVQRIMPALYSALYDYRIRNERLYERTGAVPLGIIILRARWRLFGHVLRLPADSPPSLAMGAYFAEPRPAGWRGRPRHTLPTLLQDDAKRIGLSLSSKVDLEAFRALAADRSGWVGICARVVSAP